MWILITCNNLASCQQSLRSYIEKGMKEPGVLVVNGGDSSAYVDMDIPTNWEAMRLTEMQPISKILNAMYTTYPDEKFYGLLPENAVVETDGWEEIMLRFSMFYRMTDCFDGSDEPVVFGGIKVWNGDLIRKVNKWALLDVFYYGFEWSWEKLTRDFVLRVKSDTVKISYLPLEESIWTQECEKNEERDKQTFEIWRHNEYYKLFRELMFGGDRWRGKTAFDVFDGEDQWLRIS